MVKKAQSLDTVTKEEELVAEVKPEQITEVFKSIVDSVPSVNGKRPRVQSLTDKPVLCVGGRVIELTPIEPKDLPSDVLDHQRGYHFKGQMLGDGRSGRWNNTLLRNLTAMEMSWWVAKVSNTVIYMSNGSELIAQDAIGYGTDDYYEDFGAAPMGVASGAKSVLAVVGSQIHTDTLYIEENNYVNNSSIRCKSSLSLNDSNLISVEISSKEAIHITKSNLTDVTANMADYISFRESRLSKAWFHGLKSVMLTKVSNNQEFTISLYGMDLDLNIEDVWLQPSNITSYARTPWSRSPTSRHTKVNISRRIDYGYFSSRESVPFVRINETDILVGGILFTAKELFPEQLVARVRDTGDGPLPVEQPHPLQSPWSHNSYDARLSQPYYSRSVRGGDLFNRVANIIFDYHRDNVVGKTGEILVQSLLEQIRSRVSLFVELKNIL